MRKFQLAVMACLALAISACSTFDTIQATNVPVVSGEVKIGESVCSWIFGFRHKTCSIDEAIKNGKITSVQAIDVQTFRTFFYDSKTITVRGK